jgi:ribosome-binding protein aMBF1 (putative translation factor)
MNNPFAELIWSRREQVQVSRAILAKEMLRIESWVSLIETGRRRPTWILSRTWPGALGKERLPGNP